jgi:hypothetical protein
MKRAGLTPLLLSSAGFALLVAAALGLQGCFTSPKTDTRSSRLARASAEDEYDSEDQDYPTRRRGSLRSSRGAAEESTAPERRSSRGALLAQADEGLPSDSGATTPTRRRLSAGTGTAAGDETTRRLPSSSAAGETRSAGARTPSAAARRAVAADDTTVTDAEWQSLMGPSSAKPVPLAITPTEKAVASLIQELQDPLLANAAYRRIWEAPRSAIPELIKEVENPAQSKVERLQVLVLDPAFGQESDQTPGNRIHGLGKMEMVEETAEDDVHIIQQGYIKMAYGPTSNKKGYRVLLEKPAGFPVGVVVRAGLLNRLKSTRFPTLSDGDTGPGKLLEWWRQYYALASTAKEPAPSSPSQEPAPAERPQGSTSRTR